MTISVAEYDKVTEYNSIVHVQYRTLWPKRPGCTGDNDEAKHAACLHYQQTISALTYNFMIYKVQIYPLICNNAHT